MDQRPNILAREWRVLKPLPWMLIAGAAALLAAIWIYPNLRGEKPPLPLLIHAQEKLAESDILFALLDDPAELPGAEETKPGAFLPLLGYRVTPAEGKAFSHPFTLNFQGESLDGPWTHPAKPAVASLADGKWTLLGRAPEDKMVQGKRIFAIEVSTPGTYALGFVVPERPAGAGEKLVGKGE